MQVQLHKVRGLGGHWETVEAICIPGCVATIDGDVEFMWDGELTSWRLPSAALSQLRGGSEYFDMHCTLAEGTGAPVPVAVVVGDELVAPE